MRIYPTTFTMKMSKEKMRGYIEDNYGLIALHSHVTGVMKQQNHRYFNRLSMAIGIASRNTLFRAWKELQ